STQATRVEKLTKDYAKAATEVAQYARAEERAADASRQYVKEVNDLGESLSKTASAADRLNTNFEQVRREAADPVELKVETGANLIDLGSNVLQGVAASLQIIREVNGRAPGTARSVSFLKEASVAASTAVDRLKDSAQALFKVLGTGTSAPAVNAIAKVQN